MCHATAAGEQGRGLAGGERVGAGGVEAFQVGAVVDDAAAGAGEDPDDPGTVDGEPLILGGLACRLVGYGRCCRVGR